MQRPITINDIANHLGLDRSTIHAARNPNTKRPVAPHTLQRINTAINELGYNPDISRRHRAYYANPSRSLPWPDLRDRYPNHTDSALARELGVARRTIQRFHRNGRIPWFTAERIADHLGLYPTEIWGPAYWDLFDDEAAA